MLKSINQLSKITGYDRRTIKKKLEDLPFVDGPKKAHLFESSQALPLIYAVDGLEAARAAQALSQASLNKVREEKLRRERIPLQMALDTMDEIFQALGVILKAQIGKMMTVERVNEVFEKFRAAPAKLGWAKK
jgi:hypothetical protein